MTISRKSIVKDHIIIFFPLVDWDDAWQRYQQLALRFSKDNRVIYINSPAAITYLMRNPLNLMKKWLRFVIGGKKINSNLWVYFPPPYLPFERSSRWVNRLNQYILFLYIRIFVRPKGSEILWINDPYKYLMIKLLKPKIAIYDCPDAIVFKENGRKQKVYDHLRKKILQKSPICLFTSKALLDDGKKYSRNYFYIPNGVDIENFSKRKKETPEIIKNVPGIILGVVGTLDERIDLGLLTHVLEEIKEASLFLVGPVQTQIGNLADHPRVVLTGKRPYEEMPSFIERFHVALIPYVVNSVTKAIYPVKLHEYLVLGKPVVSTDLPEVRQFSDVVRIAGTKEEFARSIRLALRERDEKAGQRRMRIAQGNSWEKRVNQISGILENYL